MSPFHVAASPNLAFHPMHPVSDPWDFRMGSSRYDQLQHLEYLLPTFLFMYIVTSVNMLRI